MQLQASVTLSTANLDQIAEATTQRILGRALGGITANHPKIGEAWPNQGGVYAGIVRDGDRQWHLIMPTTPEAITSAIWGEAGETIEGEFSRADGQHNMRLILAADPENEIANHFSALEIEGHKDFYWPAQFEQNLICINLREFIEKKWHWSSTQCSAYDAWSQDFEVGDAYIGSMHDSLAARAVRRLPIE